MKKLLLLLVMLGSLLTVNAQTSRYLEAKKASYQYGYKLSDERYQYLAQGDRFHNEGIFYAGVEYIIYAESDDSDVQDLDIKVYLPDGKILEQDTEIRNNAWVGFTLTSDVFLRVEVINYRSLDPNYMSTCRMFLMYK